MTTYAEFTNKIGWTLSVRQGTQLSDQQVVDEVKRQLDQDQYNILTDRRVAEAIRHTHDVRITDTLIESYRELAQSRILTTDPVITELAKVLPQSRPGYIDFKLDDGTTVALTEQLLNKLNTVFAQQPSVIEHIRSNVSTFIDVIRAVKE